MNSLNNLTKIHILYEILIATYLQVDFSHYTHQFAKIFL